jgi:hypothetical protein
VKRERPRTYVLAEFQTAAELLRAARTMRERGYAFLDAHTPYPVSGLSDALALPRSKVPLLTLIGGLGGATLGYLMQWWMNAMDFPINVGGRPLHSPPSCIPITFECGILLGAFGAFFGALALMRLPKPYHPVFEVEAFKNATLDRFWLSVAFTPAEFAKKSALTELERLGAVRTATVIKPEEQPEE